MSAGRVRIVGAAAPGVDKLGCKPALAGRLQCQGRRVADSPGGGDPCRRPDRAVPLVPCVVIAASAAATPPSDSSSAPGAAQPTHEADATKAAKAARMAPNATQKPQSMRLATIRLLARMSRFRVK